MNWNWEQGLHFSFFRCVLSFSVVHPYAYYESERCVPIIPSGSKSVGCDGPWLGSHTLSSPLGALVYPLLTLICLIIITHHPHHLLCTEITLLLLLGILRHLAFLKDCTVTPKFTFLIL